jgi:putative ABC transport system permease protein
MQDVKYGLRMLAKSPGFTLIAVLTLALGIGANTAIFSVVNTVLLAPLPYKHPDRLVMVWLTNPQQHIDKSPTSGGDFAEWKAENHVFSNMAASTDELYTLTGAGSPEQIIGYDFSADYFRIVGVAPQLGRTFSDGEDRPGGPNVAVLSDRLWRRKFAADRGIVGRSITLSGKPYTVIGVMPESFKLPGLVQLWTPIDIGSTYDSNYKEQFIRVIARLKPGVTVSQAQGEMRAMEQRIAQQRPETDGGSSVILQPLRSVIAGDVQIPLLVLLGAVGFVLLIACVNVANLLLARASGRKKEMAIRAALGAGRFRLVRQSLTEGLLLALAGGAAGIGLAYWLTDFLLAIFPNNIANLDIPQVTAIPLDARVLLFAVLATLATGMGFSLAPALRAAGGNVNDTLKESGTTTSASRGEVRLRNLLVMSEIALAIVLLAGAGLLIRSFHHLLDGNFGFNSDDLLAMEVFLSSNRYPSEDTAKQERFAAQVVEKISAEPGVESAAYTNYLPLSGFSNPQSYIVEGTQPKPGPEPSAETEVISPEYFRVMQIPLREGREFTAEDGPSAPQVAIINASLAATIGGDPVGRRLNLGNADHPDWWQVAGIVGDVRSAGLAEIAPPKIYRPFAQKPYRLIGFVARTAGDPMALAPAIQKAMWDVDPEQPVYTVIAMKELANESMALRRISAMLLGGFAGIALLMASIGIYGVISWTVVQQSREIGIRLALGAQRRDILRAVFYRGLALVGVGLSVGIVAALALSRLMGSLLYGVTANDPATYAGVGLLLAGVTLLACCVPAWRAMRVDPILALRHE